MPIVNLTKLQSMQQIELFIANKVKPTLQKAISNLFRIAMRNKIISELSCEDNMEVNKILK